MKRRGVEEQTGQATQTWGGGVGVEKAAERGTEEEGSTWQRMQFCENAQSLGKRGQMQGLGEGEETVSGT